MSSRIAPGTATTASADSIAVRSARSTGRSRRRVARPSTGAAAPGSRGHDVRHAVQQLGEVAAEVGVPGVGVHQVAAGQGGGRGEVHGEGAQRVVGAVSRTRGGGAGRRGRRRRTPRAGGARPGRPARRVPARELDMDTGTAVTSGGYSRVSRPTRRRNLPFSATGPTRVTQMGPVGKSAGAVAGVASAAGGRSGGAHPGEDGGPGVLHGRSEPMHLRADGKPLGAAGCWTWKPTVRRARAGPTGPGSRLTQRNSR
ncbi:hypothetical protein SFUMM280S_06634 [Streptomyces fumanus]